MLEACELNSVSEEDYLELGRAGLGSCLLGGLPDWLVAYSARVVCLRFAVISLLHFRIREKGKGGSFYFPDISFLV